MISSSVKKYDVFIKIRQHLRQIAERCLRNANNFWAGDP